MFVSKILGQMSNSIDPDQKSDLVLHCLHVPFYKKRLVYERTITVINKTLLHLSVEEINGASE